MFLLEKHFNRVREQQFISCVQDIENSLLEICQIDVFIQYVIKHEA